MIGVGVGVGVGGGSHGMSPDALAAKLVALWGDALKGVYLAGDYDLTTGDLPGRIGPTLIHQNANRFTVTAINGRGAITGTRTNIVGLIGTTVGSVIKSAIMVARIPTLPFDAPSVGFDHTYSIIVGVDGGIDATEKIIHINGVATATPVAGAVQVIESYFATSDRSTPSLGRPDGQYNWCDAVGFGAFLTREITDGERAEYRRLLSSYFRVTL